MINGQQLDCSNLPCTLINGQQSTCSNPPCTLINGPQSACSNPPRTMINGPHSACSNPPRTMINGQQLDCSNLPCVPRQGSCVAFQTKRSLSFIYVSWCEVSKELNMGNLRLYFYQMKDCNCHWCYTTTFTTTSCAWALDLCHSTPHAVKRHCI